MQKIITEFQNFIQLSVDNLWVLGDGLEQHFQYYVDKPENNLDRYLNCDYEGTPLWFYFLCLDYSLFDYFKERIVLKTDWDYTLLFNIDFIESSHYFKQISKDICYSKLTPFCPLVTLLQVVKNEDTSSCSHFDFCFPQDSFQKICSSIDTLFFHNAKIGFNISSFSYIFEKDFETGLQILNHVMTNHNFKDNFLSQLSHTQHEDFFDLKVNLFFHYPLFTQDSFIEKLNQQQLSRYLTQLIVEKKPVDKKNLFKIMSKEHLILALHTQFFSLEDLSNMITDKEIHYHLLDFKLNNLSSHGLPRIESKKTKI